MKIYTKAGDGGETGLLGGSRVLKTNLRIQAIGEVDELNAAIGFVNAADDKSALKTMLETIQCNLFDLGAELASPPGGSFDLKGPGEDETASLERSIDEMTLELPPLKNFILPGGCEQAARLHLARSVARRAERAVLNLHQTEPVSSESLAYLNRLSDWLFVAARAANARHQIVDTPWKSSR